MVSGAKLAWLNGVATCDRGELLDGTKSALGFLGEVSVPMFDACASPSTVAGGGGVHLFLLCTFSWMALPGGVCNTELPWGNIKLKPLPPVVTLLHCGHTNVEQSIIINWFGCACDNIGNCCKADNGLLIPSGVRAEGYTNGNWVPGVVGVKVGLNIIGSENGCGTTVGKETAAAAKFTAFSIGWEANGDFNIGVIISLFPGDKVLDVGGAIELKSLLLSLGLSLLDLLPLKDGSVNLFACLACLFSWYL